MLLFRRGLGDRPLPPPRGGLLLRGRDVGFRRVGDGVRCFRERPWSSSSFFRCFCREGEEDRAGGEGRRTEFGPCSGEPLEYRLDDDVVVVLGVILEGPSSSCSSMRSLSCCHTARSCPWVGECSFPSGRDEERVAGCRVEPRRGGGEGLERVPEWSCLGEEDAWGLLLRCLGGELE